MRNKKIKVNDLKIGSLTELPKSIYRINCSFMFGDADGFEDISVDIPEHDKTEALKLLQVIYDCIYCNRNGSDGFESVKELIEHYNVPDFTKYIAHCDGSHLEHDGYDDSNKSIYDLAEYTIPMPVDQNGYFGAFDGVNIEYYDANGLQYEVTVI